MSWRKTQMVMRKIVAVLAVVILANSAVYAQSVYPDRPMTLRITGTFLSVDEPKREDLILVDVFVQDTPRRLRIGKVEDLNPSGRGEAIKEDLLMRQVRFYGESALIDRLEKPETLGKVLTLEGQLDQKTRRFRVTSVSDGAESTPSSR
jgi:hypothetical protein